MPIYWTFSSFRRSPSVSHNFLAVFDLCILISRVVLGWNRYERGINDPALPAHQQQVYRLYPSKAYSRAVLAFLSWSSESNSSRYFSSSFVIGCVRIRKLFTSSKSGLCASASRWTYLWVATPLRCFFKSSDNREPGYRAKSKNSDKTYFWVLRINADREKN